MEKVIIGFSRFLAGRNLPVSTAQLLAAVRAAELVGPASPRELRAALRAAFCPDRNSFLRFETLFNEYFNKNTDQENQQVAEAPSKPHRGILARDQDKSEDYPDRGMNPASALEVLGRVGFKDLNPEQALWVAEEVRGLLAPLARRLSRRKRPGSGRELNWRTTMRRGLGSGGELVDLRHRRPRQKPRRLLVMADISGSMDMSTPYLFHFLQGLQGAWRQVEVFVFATRLTRLTPWLASLGVSELVAHLPRLVPDLAGGTLIGRSLVNLFQQPGRLPSPGSVVLLVSDGWDRGDPEELARQMVRLKARCRRVFWLNPLLESPRYRPINRGMAVALPYVDHFLACHNLNSLARVAELLAQSLK